MNVTITEIASHRNGVSGRSFYAVAFTCPENGPMIAALFPNGEDAEGLPTFNTAEPEIAVFQRDRVAEGVITFGVNSWRGDHYSDALVAAVRADAKRRYGYTCIACGHHHEGQP